MHSDGRLVAHLATWLGVWPPPDPQVTVVGSPRRTRPGWDGSVRPVAGVSAPQGTVLSVPPDRVEAVSALGGDLESIGPGLAEALELPGHRFVVGVFRWTMRPTAGDRPGVWIAREDPRVPEWLRPFNGDVLVGISDGAVAAGVGRKQHDRWGHELAVVTDEAHRGLGWAWRLVSQAAERVLEDGAVPTYLHPPGHAASARTADAAGFPDLGWRILGLFAGPPG